MENRNKTEMITIPTIDVIMDKVRIKAELSPLENLIYKYSPYDIEQEIEFRALLTEVLKSNKGE
jgi:hypothetical protein